MRGHRLTVIIIILYHIVTESQWLNLYIITQFQCDIFAQTQYLLLRTSCMGSLILEAKARRTIIRYYAYAGLYLVSSQNPHGVTLAFKLLSALRLLEFTCSNHALTIAQGKLFHADHLVNQFSKHRKTVGKECWYKHQVCILLEMIIFETIIGITRLRVGFRWKLIVCSSQSCSAVQACGQGSSPHPQLLTSWLLVELVEF